MKLAIVGSRNKSILIESEMLPEDITEIVSGGANGIDRCAQRYAEEKGIAFTVFLPKYEKYGRAAPIIRNKLLVDYSDQVVAFWDGSSKGTESVIDYCRKCHKKCTVIIL